VNVELGMEEVPAALLVGFALAVVVLFDDIAAFAVFAAHAVIVALFEVVAFAVTAAFAKRLASAVVVALAELLAVVVEFVVIAAIAAFGAGEPRLMQQEPDKAHG